MPPNLIDELMRDRRWCQGNLINSRLFFTQGLHAAHRAVFFTGVMAYVSAPLWFVFLLLSTANLAVHTLVEPEYFTAPAQLFPMWPEWHPDRAIFLFTMTAMLLFLPKLASVALLLAAHKARAFGGTAKLGASMLAEFVFSALLAPIRMLFHTQFVLSSLLGWKITWKSPPRDDAQTPWTLAFRRHGAHTLIGLAWAAFVYWLNPSFLWWLLPVAGALALSIPISVFSTRVSLGRRARAARLFLIPEETAPPRELRRMRAYTKRATSAAAFIDAVVDPLHNAMACAGDLARTPHSKVVRRANRQLVARALAHGPDALDADEKNALLGDAIALSALHFDVWDSPDAHPAWKAAREHRVHGKHHVKETAVPYENLKLATAIVAEMQPVIDDAVGSP
jgi:membrane glycosyltransferase